MKKEKKKLCIRIYISGKMTGLTRKEYENNFKVAEEKAKKIFKQYYEEVIIFNPAFKTVNTCNGFSYEECMEMDFLLIKLSHLIYLLPNWQESKGANREKHYAHSQNKNFYYGE